MKRMLEIGEEIFKTDSLSRSLRKDLWKRLRFRLDRRIGRVQAPLIRRIEWKLNPCPYHGIGVICQICEPMPQRMIDSLNNQRKRFGRHRRGCAPLRKRRKRLHKKLAKRGFSATPTSTIWSSPRPGYGIEGTEYDWMAKWE